MSIKVLEALKKEKQTIRDLTEVAVDVGNVVSLIRKLVNRIKLRRAKRRADKLLKQLEKEGVQAPADEEMAVQEATE